MSMSNIPLFTMLRERMEWLHTRQNVLSENVANANTPAYTARDVEELDFRNMLSKTRIRPVKMAVTSERHLVGNPELGGTAIKRIDSPDSEVSPSGNSVVLEEQMFKVAETQMDYQTATNLYAKGVSLIRLAITGRT